jgi:hypothetical protein
MANRPNWTKATIKNSSSHYDETFDGIGDSPKGVGYSQACYILEQRL